MKKAIAGLLLLFSVCAFAQKSPIKFGEVSLEELNMKVYPNDSSAEAAVLVDYGEADLSILNGTAKLRFERHVRIKILKKEGLQWADATVRLYDEGGESETINGLKASTYNLENGKIVETKMSKDNVFKERFNRYYKLQKFTLPAVKEGSVIEYSYTINSDLYTLFPNWEFQKSIPVAHSEYWAMIPEFFIYEKYMQGYIPVTNYEVVNKSKSTHTANAHHWVVKNAPAFKAEPYMTTEEDYISRINFALSHINFPGEPVQEIMGSWEKLNERLLESESFGKAITASGFLKNQVEAITAGITEPEQKVMAIHNYVKENIKWDGYNDYAAASLKKIMEVKKGTTGDVNILLASMLEKAGFTVDMVLLSTRDHGIVRREFPMSRQFNYVVCAVRLGDKTILLDATEPFLPMNVLPERCLNGAGLIISKTNHGWMNLQTKVKAKTIVSADLMMNPDGELKGKLVYQRDGYDGMAMRKSYLNKGEETYLKDFLKDKTWQVENTAFANIQQLDLGTTESHNLVINDHATAAGNLIYINPFVTGSFETNPFKLPAREYPVDFGSNLEKIYMCKLSIPDGYAVDELPQSKMWMLPGNAGKYMYNVSQSGNTIHITSNFQINKSLFLTEEYPNLREFYNLIIAKQAEQIVLKKNP